MEKVELLEKLYFDPSGYQSVQNLYKDAKKEDKTITLKFVKEWYDIYNEKTRYYGSKNSFIAPHAHYEYQIDLFFLAHLKNQKFRVGMACIDIFTKYAVAVPIPSKKTSDVLAGIMECLTKMKHKPLFIYSDEEGALTSKDVKGYLDKEKIEIITTRNHAHFVERFIRTFKVMLRKRMDYDLEQGKENIQWTDYVFPILLTYNNKNEHSAIDMTPAEATKEDKHIDVKVNLEERAKRSRTYPDIKMGDLVKVMLKYNKMRKEHNPLYSKTKYEVEDIQDKHGLKLYEVNGRMRLRNEWIKS